MVGRGGRGVRPHRGWQQRPRRRGAAREGARRNAGGGARRQARWPDRRAGWLTKQQGGTVAGAARGWHDGRGAGARSRREVGGGEGGVYKAQNGRRGRGWGGRRRRRGWGVDPPLGGGGSLTRLSPSRLPPTRQPPYPGRATPPTPVASPPRRGRGGCCRPTVLGSADTIPGSPKANMYWGRSHCNEDWEVKKRVGGARHVSVGFGRGETA